MLSTSSNLPMENLKLSYVHPVTSLQYLLAEIMMCTSIVKHLRYGGFLLFWFVGFCLGVLLLCFGFFYEGKTKKSQSLIPF